MPLTYAAPIYFTPIPAAGKHIHTKLLKMRWNQDFKGKDFGYQIGYQIGSWNTSQKEPFFKEVLYYSGSRRRKVKTSSWKGAKPRVVSSECQPKQVLGEIYQQSLSWREVMSYALNGDGKDRYIQPGVFLNPFNTARCSKWPARNRHLSQ